MGKGLHKVFKNVDNDILQAMPISGESGSEFSYFIPEPRNFTKVTRLSEDIKKPRIKATMKNIKYLIKNQTFLVQGDQMCHTYVMIHLQGKKLTI